MTKYVFAYTCEVDNEDYDEFFCGSFEKEFEDDFEAVGYAFLRAALYESAYIKVNSIYVFEAHCADNVLLDIGK